MQEGPPTTTAHSSFSPGETLESGYSPEGSNTIGWDRDDSGRWGPPVERWSSVDSWATALSDWAEIISAPLEDITAAFTEIGAEIDALTQALAEVTTHTEEEETLVERQGQVQTQPPMGVQDQPLEAEKIAESSIFSGQSCLSFCLEQGPRRVQSLCDCRQKQTEEIQRGPCSSMGSSGVEVASSGSGEATATPESTLSAELGETPANFFYFGYDEPVMIDNDVILNIVEDADLEEKTAPTELVIKEPSTDGVCEVEDEHIFYAPGLVAEQKSRKSLGPAEILQTDRRGAKPSPVPYFHSTSLLTNSHVPNVDNQASLNVNTETHVLLNTFPDLDRACQVEPQWGSPKFIMPLAPLGISSSFTRQTSSSLKGKDQICARSSPNDKGERNCNLWPTLDGITDCFSVEPDEDLIHKKESTVDSAEESSFLTDKKTSTQEIGDLSHFVPVDHFVISKEKHVACITLDLYDPFGSNAAKSSAAAVLPEKPELKTQEKMPHKTHKTTSECKTRSKKDRSVGHHHHHGTQVSKKQENVPHHVPTQQTCKTQDNLPGENCTRQDTADGREDKEVQLVIESGVGAEKGSSKSHGKKKKKHTQNTAAVKGVTGEPLGEVENGTVPQSAKGRIDAFEAKLGTNTGKAVKDSNLSDSREKKSQKSEAKEEKPLAYAEHKDQPPKSAKSPLSDDVIKRRRLSQDKFGKIVSALESKLPKADAGIQAKGEEAKADVGATRKKAYSEVVKQKPVLPKEDPKVVQPIQAVSVSRDPQSLCLWCQFAAVFTDYTVTWSREGTTLAETKRSAGDESRVSLTISNASNKDLGKYQCRLSSSHGSVVLDYLLTYEVLSEIVIPSTPKISSSAPVEVESEEEDVRCSRLIFKEDFLSEQYFGENHPASIITEKVHFGEGMHRRAFRTKLQAGQIPLLLPGHSCVLKVHNAISYGTKNNEELVQKNFNLAVEECQVQNTAREYIKAYDAVAQSLEAFGEVPEIIPIYLVHRPSSDIPYATLEEELIGDFVKYSVKDGKEINLMRRDSEAGQKCCAFQHWVYHKTEGNLLVTDMQGVGMRLTDVGIATCKKGYKGFRGNCATSFIDQFKALHQCNMYCEILGLKSLQPKPKKPASAPKPKAQPAAAPKKKVFGPTVKGKS
ncbi:alpha-protein kinase 2 isoform X2 [Sphaeramia orbicularis]|uniref:alpha-protein kinase 2 isoform X2 n=1 Tax=Sphaeramia orbicularis TaxID=375764 RepID=UPI00117EF4C1|nr:alpha-protein kinase 2-like isoform X2 [Sphaeramia orbicularis]